MAKKINGLRIVYIIVCLLVIGTGLVVTFTLQGASIASTSTRIVELKDEGCDPAEEANARCLVLETNYKHTKECLDDLKTGQQVLLEAIRER